MVNGLFEGNSISNYTQLLYLSAKNLPGTKFTDIIIRNNTFFLTCYPKPGCGASDGSDAPGIFVSNNKNDGTIDRITIENNTCGDLSMDPNKGGDCIRLVGPITNVVLRNNDLGPAKIEISGSVDWTQE